MKIKSHLKVYDVTFINDLNCISEYVKEGNTFFVIGHNVYRIYNEHFSSIPQDRLSIIEALEVNKSIETALNLCEKITNMSSKRNTHLISIGGGITQDITGFVANVLYRGIYWTFFPSTLLAACDSCIGGKTSLNYKGFKNLLGTFYPPDHIKIYTKFFNTLEDKDYYSGLGEVVKFNVMLGLQGIDEIESNLQKLIHRESTTISKFVKSSLAFKKDFIEEDEFDKGKRVLLNFAHTFGHAFEVSSLYSIPHGTAVALGMVVANRISVFRGILDEKVAVRIEDVCKKIIPNYVNKNFFDLEIILSAIRKDKKQINASFRAVLMKKNFSLEVFNDLTELEIKSAINFLREIFLREGGF